MRRNIVEGEPGIFPDPVARFMRAVSRWVRRRKGEDTGAPEAEAGPDAGRSGHEPPPGPPAT